MVDNQNISRALDDMRQMEIEAARAKAAAKAARADARKAVKR